MRSAAKVALHTRIAMDPDLHAWTLSLYRAGEHYPDVVDDYFPIEACAERWPWLAKQLRRHAAEEKGHVGLYTRAIRSLGREPEEADGLDVFNEQIRRLSRATWRIEPGDGPEVRRIRIAHFLAHAHTLEKRVERSMGFHLAGCEAAWRRGRPLEVVLEVVQRVRSDETRHVASTYEAFVELTRPLERADLLEVHARGEAAAHVAFSARQLRSLQRRFGARLGPAVRWGVRLGAELMEARVRAGSLG